MGTLPTAGRAEPQGPGVLPKTWGCSSLALLAVAAGSLGSDLRMPDLR